MPLRNAIPLRFKPRGVYDTLDDQNSPPGAMSSLSNLVPDPSTPFAFQCRPAAAVKYTFGDFTTPGVISVAFQVGTRIFGMIATARNAGHDEPFCYDLAINSFVAISGTISGATTPLTPASSGAWTPPTMDMVGVLLYVTHPGFPGGGVNFGWFDLTNPAAPAWHAGDTGTNSIGGVATCVRSFNNRAYLSFKNILFYTDTLANNMSLSTQFLTIGDTDPITALCPLSIVLAQQAVVQGLLAFKRNLIDFVTGDAAFTNLASNTISPQGVGTAAGRSVTSSPLGVFFMDDDGVRLVNLDATISDPIEGIRLPFINAVQPSRASGCYENGVYRLCIQNGQAAGSPYQEYWFHTSLSEWSGPHTKRQDMAVPYQGTVILFDSSIPAKLYQSFVFQVAGVGFVEDGAQLSWMFSTAPIGEDESMTVHTSNEMSINMAFATGQSVINFTASDQLTGVISQCSITSPPGGSLWGSFLWGIGIWFGTQYGIAPYLIPWTNPLVFTKLIFQATGLSYLGFKVSNFRLLLQPAGYYPLP